MPLAVPCRTAGASPERSDRLLTTAADANSQAPVPAPNLETAAEHDPERLQNIQLRENNARSVWTTSVYSYAPGGGGPGGGRVDDQLKIGGWGDIYVSLISFRVVEMRRTVRKAVIILSSAPSPSGSSPTPMRLLRVTDPWGYRGDDRLWWRNRPRGVVHSILPAPDRGSDKYYVDVTEIYNDWANLRYPVLGIMFEPVDTDNHYNIFYSTRADAARRPVLQITY